MLDWGLTVYITEYSLTFKKNKNKTSDWKRTFYFSVLQPWDSRPAGWDHRGRWSDGLAASGHQRPQAQASLQILPWGSGVPPRRSQPPVPAAQPRRPFPAQVQIPLGPCCSLRLAGGDGEGLRGELQAAAQLGDVSAHAGWGRLSARGLQNRYPWTKLFHSTVLVIYINVTMVGVFHFLLFFFLCKLPL